LKYAIWFFLSCSMFFSIGCTTNYKLSSAVSERDVGEIEKILNFIDGKPAIKIESNLKADAVGIASSYYLDYFLSERSAEFTLKDFDNFCYGAISRRCSQETRKRILSIELEERKKREERLLAAEKLHREKLKSGLKTIKTRKDAEIMYSPKDGFSLLGSPNLLGGDNTYYTFKTFVTGYKNGEIISWWPEVDYSAPRWGAVISGIQNNLDSANKGLEVYVVGKYVGNRRLHLGFGQFAIVPHFSDAYVFPVNY